MGVTLTEKAADRSQEDHHRAEPAGRNGSSRRRAGRRLQRFFL